ncbi:MAG: hypothetical protein KKC25_05470 [Proteobacteria bacterium]|nr:hypothetical protein [Pseudomonadota bacterium]
MAPSKVWYMDARARRFLESTAIKDRQIIERSGVDSYRSDRPGRRQTGIDYGTGSLERCHSEVNATLLGPLIRSISKRPGVSFYSADHRALSPPSVADP